MGMTTVRKYKYTIWYILAVFTFGFVIYSAGYFNAKDVYINAIAACERGKLDRHDNADGWAAARDTRLAAAQLSNDKEEILNNYEAARQYEKITTSLESRIRPCKQLVEERPVWILWHP